MLAAAIGAVTGAWAFLLTHITRLRADVRCLRARVQRLEADIEELHKKIDILRDDWRHDS